MNGHQYLPEPVPVTNPVWAWVVLSPEVKGT